MTCGFHSLLSPRAPARPDRGSASRVLFSARVRSSLSLPCDQQRRLLDPDEFQPALDLPDVAAENRFIAVWQERFPITTAHLYDENSECAHCPRLPKSACSSPGERVCSRQEPPCAI